VNLLRKTKPYTTARLCPQQPCTLAGAAEALQDLQVIAWTLLVDVD
jgi:hypothetical protein